MELLYVSTVNCLQNNVRIAIKIISLQHKQLLAIIGCGQIGIGSFRFRSSCCSIMLSVVTKDADALPVKRLLCPWKSVFFLTLPWIISYNASPFSRGYSRFTRIVDALKKNEGFCLCCFCSLGFSSMC